MYLVFKRFFFWVRIHSSNFRALDRKKPWTKREIWGHFFFPHVVAELDPWILGTHFGKFKKRCLWTNFPNTQVFFSRPVFVLFWERIESIRGLGFFNGIFLRCGIKHRRKTLHPNQIATGALGKTPAVDGRTPAPPGMVKTL